MSILKVLSNPCCLRVTNEIIKGIAIRKVLYQSLSGGNAFFVPN
jgi:hypothetical protein